MYKITAVTYDAPDGRHLTRLVGLRDTSVIIKDYIFKTEFPTMAEVLQHLILVTSVQEMAMKLTVPSFNFFELRAGDLRFELYERDRSRESAKKPVNFAGHLRF